METRNRPLITVSAVINAPIHKVWRLWTTPGHIIRWNNASDDWHTPRAENDLRPGGRFLSRMEARDGSVGFDFSGTYETVNQYEKITYELDDGRRVTVTFSAGATETRVVETFEAESENSLELQQTGWQSILDNFKRYAETGSSGP